MSHRFRDPSIGFTNSSILTPFSPKIFKDCLKYLVKNNYTVVSCKDLVLLSQRKYNFYKTVCLTIDDGYIDFKNIAYPLLKKFNLPATVFITTDFIEGKLMMWWDQLEYLIDNTKKPSLYVCLTDQILTLPLRSKIEKTVAILTLTNQFKTFPLTKIHYKLQQLSTTLEVTIPDKPPKKYSALCWNDIREMEKDGIDFQPHTVNHPILSRIILSDQEWQIYKCIKSINENINSDPIVFCYPNGTYKDFTKETVTILKKCNFAGACSTICDYFNPKNTDLFYIPRFPFPSNYNNFIETVSGCRRVKLAVKKRFYKLKGSLKNSLNQ
jgi:peptidoglycan/xylan/chitin deacetylase (PgdA/CDA1 family)